MMTITTIDRLGEFVEKNATLRGWVYNTRSSGKLAFIILRDGTGLCQCVLEKSEATESFFDEAKKLPQESAVEITGLVAAEAGSVGGFELRATGLKVVHLTRASVGHPKQTE